ncbi:hypothetical protein EDD18DRAFT_1126597 [Armillaria luteobubalina]|uniref:Mid2 domain-containing protein n=1 Tax=Armillaria luteobubalina TaxID=153913 RepID=A0AA39QND2_9AGAR|nr:hypothetical protein EDD18DRAFT_1126597 [Armillaria luteobubalina]
MASLNLTVEDGSPLIFYNPVGAWIDSPNDDSSLPASLFPPLSAELFWSIFAYHFYGGCNGYDIFSRPSYGTYTVSLDGQRLSKGNASDIQASTRRLLATASGLSNGNHTAVITNTGPAIDIDYIDIECEIGSGPELITIPFDDIDSHISYLPSESDWSINDKPAFINGTLHFTNVTDASASLSFTGDAVTLYGTVSPDHANMRVSVDGRETTFSGGSNGSVSSLHPGYFSNALGPDNHTITISAYREPSTGPFIDIDAIIVYSSNETNNESGPVNGARQPVASSPSSDASPPDSNSVATSTIVGAVLGGVGGLALLAALLFLLYRRKRLDRPREDAISPSTPDLPMQRPEMLEPDDNALLRRLEPLRTVRYQSRLSIAPSYYSGGSSDWVHSRTQSIVSATSTTPITRTVPTLKTPQPPSRLGAGMPVVCVPCSQQCSD